MSSIYDELCEKLRRDPRLTKRGGARVDLSLLLFNARDELHGLWQAADRFVRFSQADDLESLKEAVEKLRIIFGPRTTPGTDR